jgi:HEAT repeat protein
MTLSRWTAVACVALVAAAPASLDARQTAGPVDTAIARLVAFDLPTRTAAARDIRRANRDVAVPALTNAVRSNPDEYIRFRALVLLTGFEDPATPRLMREVMTDRNDRLRTVAYQWFEHHPDPDTLTVLIAGLESERSEFVRPALTRAIAAAQTDARAGAALTPLVLRGEDLFRGAVIEALGDYHHAEAISPIVEVAELDGPLQDDALTALGELGNPESRTTLVTVQASAPPELQSTIAASLCLIGLDCDAQVAYVQRTLDFAAADADRQPLLRGAVHAMAMLARHGRPEALGRLLDAGVAARDPVRAAIAIGIGRIALRDPALVVAALEPRTDRAACLDLVLDAFDRLSEDFEEEQFFVAVRAALWAAPDGSPRRETARQLIEKLEF